MKPRKLRIAARASKLALKQADIAASLLRKIDPDIEIELVKITTKGDIDKSSFLGRSTQGWFTSEVENALLTGSADLAVHSLKDLPVKTAPSLSIAAVPPRGSPADVLITNDNTKSIHQLKPHAKIGTSSLRRRAQILTARPDLQCLPLRGNVETRIQKLKANQYDAIILAHAGLIRLNLENEISAVLDPEQFVPSPGQGALALQCRTDDKELIALLKKIDDPAARLCTSAERKLLEKLGTGCSVPLGAYAEIKNNTLTITALLADPAGKVSIKKSARCSLDNIETTIDTLAQDLLSASGKQILNSLNTQT